MVLGSEEGGWMLMAGGGVGREEDGLDAYGGNMGGKGRVWVGREYGYERKKVCRKWRWADGEMR